MEVPWIVELDESKRGPALVLQVDEVDLAKLVEEILDVLGTNVRRKVPDVDAAIVVVLRHVWSQEYDDEQRCTVGGAFPMRRPTRLRDPRSRVVVHSRFKARKQRQRNTNLLLEIG